MKNAEEGRIAGREGLETGEALRGWKGRGFSGWLEGE